MVEDIFKYDQGGLLKKLTCFDSKLPERVNSILKPILEQDVQIQRINERLRLSFGRDGKAVPPTKVVYWQFEMFQAVLHDQANMLFDRLWRMGRWGDEAELLILLNSQPDIALHLAIFNSRILRPNLDEPCEQFEGLSDISVVEGDPRYSGWMRLGYIEEQYLSHEHDYSRPTELIKVFSGAIVAPLGGSCSQNYFPFLDGNYEFWWNQAPAMIYRRPFDICTQLLLIDRVTDWMGDHKILMPPAELCALADEVVLPMFGEGLVWKDAESNPIAVCRFWHVQGQQFDVESPRLVGCDLIVRPDMVHKLEETFSCPIKIYTNIFTKEI
jgi:hypothetical protein